MQKDLPAHADTREFRAEQSDATYQNKAAAATIASKVITTVPTSENHSGKHGNVLETAMPPDVENAEDEGKPKRVKKAYHIKYCRKKRQITMDVQLLIIMLVD